MVLFFPGKYYCQISIDGMELKAKAVVNITLLPLEITINPLQKSLTSKDTSQLQLECCVPYDEENYNVTWAYGNVIVAALPG